MSQLESRADEKGAGELPDWQASLESLKHRFEQAAAETTRIGDAPLKDRAYVCAFFTSPEEERDAMVPFIKEGLERGDKSVHSIDPERLQDHLRRLTDAKIDVEAYSRTKQLEVKSWNELYLASGRFERAFTEAGWSELLQGAQKDGYRNNRVMAHMEWLTRCMDSLDELLMIEASWNMARFQAPPTQCVCTYDIRKYRADTIIDVMRTHPQILIGKTVYENPFFVQPEEFMREIEGRAQKHALR